MNSFPSMVTVTPSRDSFTSTALQRLEAVNHGFDARAREPGFFHQARVLLAQIVLIRFERLVLGFEAPARLDKLIDAAFQNFEIQAFGVLIVGCHGAFTIGLTPSRVNAFGAARAGVNFPSFFTESPCRRLSLTPWKPQLITLSTT